MEDTQASAEPSRCTATAASGSPCQAPAVRGSRLCFWHNPLTRTKADGARHVGGMRRRREKLILREHDLGGLDTVSGIRRVAAIAVTDALGLENSIARSRVLIAGAVVLVKVLELEALVEALTIERDLPSAPRDAPKRRTWS
jgi:hypothetical protein